MITLALLATGCLAQGSVDSAGQRIPGSSADGLRFVDLRPNLGSSAGQLVNDPMQLALLSTVKKSWVSGPSKHFEGWTLQDAQRLLGTHNATGALLTSIADVTTRTYASAPADLPTNFDWRDKASMCPSLAEVRDQSTCGSCWAFGSVEAMTDRICIASNGTSQVHLSAQDVTSCDHLSDMGCNGGIPMTAYTYYKRSGVVTGGNYGDKTLCWSYQMAPCEHHTNGTHYPACDGDKPTPACARKCENGDTWKDDKHYGASTYNLKSVEDMMQDIYQNGPITAQYFVYSDFLNYQSGVYEHKIGHGQMLGGHAIKIMGFGTDEESGLDYWLVANSWNRDWGDNGFFKIVRGKNNCQIENFALNGGPVAGEPNLRL